MKRTCLIALLAFGIACASIPAKQKAVNGVQLAETTLGQAQDIERQLCNPTLAAQTPSAVITHCEGPTATAIKLDDAKHKQFAQALSTAFGLQVKATTALQAWRSGDPAPASLVELKADINAALQVVQQLVQGPQDGNVRSVILQVEKALTTITTAIAELKGGA